jgi:hypothetical protein
MTRSFSPTTVPTDQPTWESTVLYLASTVCHPKSSHKVHISLNAAGSSVESGVVFTSRTEHLAKDPRQLRVHRAHQHHSESHASMSVLCLDQEVWVRICCQQKSLEKATAHRQSSCLRHPYGAVIRDFRDT